MNSKQRPIRRWLAFGSLVAFAFALCVLGARTQSGTTVTVTITPGTHPTASPDPATISMANHDQVEWTCPKCTSGFSVQFPANGSPFSSGSFDNAHAQSGQANRKGLFPYKITADGQSSDPGVQVNP
jgi:hypothetical protein